MATYVEINNVRYEASITGRLNDQDWNNRASKAIHLKMAYADALNTFIDEVKWNIIYEQEVQREDAEGNIETVIEEEVYDNSEYSKAGTITDHRDGTITVKMGQPTAEELFTILIGG